MALKREPEKREWDGQSNWEPKSLKRRQVDALERIAALLERSALPAAFCLALGDDDDDDGSHAHGCDLPPEHDGMCEVTIECTSTGETSHAHGCDLPPEHDGMCEVTLDLYTP